MHWLMKVGGRSSGKAGRGNKHPALQDGASLQALEASHVYYALLKWHTRKVVPILHQERLEEAKNKVEEMTGLRPTNEKQSAGRPGPQNLYIHSVWKMPTRGGNTQGTQSGEGGFVLPTGVTRPNRSASPPHPGHTAGMKRSAEYALTCGLGSWRKWEGDSGP